MTAPELRRIDPAGRSPRELYGLLTSVVVPRPIALVSTSNGAGGHNLAPFSFFMGVASDPPTLALAMGARRSGDKKDTLRNLETTGDFVVNVVTEALAQAMNVTATDFPYGEDEFARAGLTPAPAERVAAPRVAESPVQMECRLGAVLEVGRQPAHLVLGEVVLFHLHPDVLAESGAVVDVGKLRPVARLGGSDYAPVREVFSMLRPLFRAERAR